MGKCAICSKISYMNGHLFSVPRNEQIRQEWSDECGVALELKSYVCADHFRPSDLRVSANRVCLNTSAVPSAGIVARTVNGNENCASKFTKPIKRKSCQKEKFDYGAADTVELYTTPIPVPVNTAAGAKRKCNTTAFEACWTPAIVEAFIEEDVLEEDKTHLACTVAPTVCTPEEVYTTTVDAQTQTDNNVILTNIELDNIKLIKEIKKLKSDNAALRSKVEKKDNFVDSLGSIFTEGQIRKMQTSNKRIKWSSEDICNAICIRDAAGPKAYHHLYEKGYPLPHVSTLQRQSTRLKPTEQD